MKRLIWLFLISNLYCHENHVLVHTPKEPVLVVVIMVKNEEAVIQNTLQCFLEGGINHIVVYDTGSTDATIERVQELVKQHPTAALTVIQEPFIDFAASRNKALAYAKTCYPHAGFFVMPDAEWYLQHADRLLSFCRNELKKRSCDPTYHHDVYTIKISVCQCHYPSSRLFSGSSCVQFERAIHEVPALPATCQVPDPVHFVHAPSKRGLKKSYVRWRNDLKLLKEELAINPHDPLPLFYVGHTYACLGEWENAVHFLKKRALVLTTAQQDFQVACFLGQIYATYLNDWRNAKKWYRRAHTLCPQRAEPLVRMAQHYWQEKNYKKCYTYACQATACPYPSADAFYVEHNLYSWVRYDLLASSAFYVGEWVTGYNAAHFAYKQRPDVEHVVNNWYAYQRKMKELGLMLS